MADTGSVVSTPENGDAELLRLGEQHKAMLERYEALTGPGCTEYGPALQLSDEINALEDQIIEIPALTMAGLIVRLRVLWTSLDHDLTSMFHPPAPDDDILRRLAWGILQDAERIADKP